MKRLPVSPLIRRALVTAERDLGIEEFSKRLGIAGPTIRAWSNGDAEVPDRAFLKLVEILTELDPQWLQRRRSNKREWPAVEKAKRLAENYAVLKSVAREAINKADAAVKRARAIRAQVGRQRKAAAS